MIDRDAILDILIQKNNKDLNLQTATVTSVDPLKIILDGDADPLPYTPLKLSSAMLLNVNDRVLVAMMSSAIILGRIGPEYEDIGGATHWDELDGKPDTFPPSPHSHSGADITSGTLDAARIPNLDASKITSGTFAAARIPNLDASKITSGTFSTARIPDLAASKITSGVFDTARIPDLDASKITSGTLSTARIPTITHGMTNFANQALNTSSNPNFAGIRVGGTNVVSSGSNSNGWWVRWHDGTQICGHEGARVTISNSAGGNVYWNSRTFTYPASFISTPRVAPFARRDNLVSWAGLRAADSSGCDIYALAVNSSATAYPGYIAFGWWK